MFASVLVNVMRMRVCTTHSVYLSGLEKFYVYNGANETTTKKKKKEFEMVS